MTSTYMYYNLMAAIVLIGVSAWATAYYWRKRIAAQRKVDKNKHSSNLFREQVANERAKAAARNNQDVMSHVLKEIQAQQEGINSLLQLLDTTKWAPGQQGWSLALQLLKQKNLLLADILTATLEMMFYEKQQKIAKKDEVAVNQFCHDVFENCVHLLADGVKTQVETSVADERMIRTNTDTLKRIISNLLINSMSNTREGYISLKITENKARRLMVFAVTDTGPAIPPEFQEKIFKRLPNINIHQLLLTLRVRTGKLMARLLGGTLYVDSYIEKGNTVVFTITV